MRESSRSRQAPRPAREVVAFRVIEKGQRPASDVERSQYAHDFVAACRQKELHAVAITDHHDLAFYRYIKEAADAETDEAGMPLPQDSRLIVFPGMELTLGVPCQALLILDADFPTDLLTQVLQALSISPAPDGDLQHADIKRLEHIKTITALYEELDKREFLRGRYIVFPHVGESGNFSIIRRGFVAQYKDMPCVGGFVDGSIAKLGQGRSDILAGKNKEYGNKALAIFQTSDARSRDFADLGTCATWVKWAEPTAEALRQACLARHSRIAHEPPKLPSVRITGLEVSNSKFLGPVTLDFNPQYNALIGGRGTGKSTILEYSRWALCDQPPTISDGTELADFQKRRQALIDNTLIPLAATIDISFLVDGVPHVVRRRAAGDLLLKIGHGEFQSCAEENVRGLLPVRAYSQKQLSAVGARIDELRRFVHAPVRGELAALDEKIANLRTELRSAFGRLQRYRLLTGELTAYELERRSVSERIEKLRASLKGLSDDDRATIARQTVYDAEERVVGSLERDAENAKNAVSSAAEELSRIPRMVDLEVATENAETLRTIQGALSSWAAAARDSVAAVGDAFVEPVASKALGTFYKGIEEWRRRRELQHDEYEEARKRAAAHEETLRQIAALEGRLKEINQLTDSKSEQIQQLGSPEPDFAGLRALWIQLFSERAELLEGQCAELSAIPNTRLRARLRRAADVTGIADHLKQLFRGTKISAAKTGILLQAVSDAEAPLEAWHSVLNELLELAWIKVEDESTTTLPPVPRLDSAGLTTREKMALARKLEPTNWLEVLLFDLKDLPVFEYRIREQDFIAFQDASPGQQATALLSILLLQDGPPLVIDQPEDDLNMKIMSEVVETLWWAKAHRQIIFASHNANLVVNGDAELVVSCDYRTTTTESGGKIKLTGAIDVRDIKDEITDVMEGGVDAFKLRQKKYGF